MKTLKIGMSGPEVVTLQQELNEEKYGLVIDGVFGFGTENAVKDFQRKNGLIADGIVGDMTWAALLDEGEVPDARFSPIVDEYYPLLQGQYNDTNDVRHLGITLHHTVSAGSPYPVVNGWNADNRGAVGTHFVIGGIGLDGDRTHDGKILQCVAFGDWLHHMLTTRMGKSNDHNTSANKLYVGIEICSFGCLQYKDGKFYTMDGTNRVVPESMVEVLQQDWRTYKYWHKYSDAQVEKTVALIKELDRHLGLVLSASKYDKLSTLFDLSWDALAFRRKLTTHSSFEDGKFDAYPCERLIQKLGEAYPSLR